MTTREERANARKNKIKIRKIKLHSSAHNSFHFELNDTQSWNLLYTMSINEWEKQNNKKAPLKVDKTKLRIIKLEDK